MSLCFCQGSQPRRTHKQANAPSDLNLLLEFESFLSKVIFKKKKNNKKTKLQHHSVRHFADGAHSLLNMKKKKPLISHCKETGYIFFAFFAFWMLFYVCFVWNTNIGNINFALIAFFVIVYIPLRFLKKNAPMMHEIQMGAGSGEK